MSCMWGSDLPDVGLNACPLCLQVLLSMIDAGLQLLLEAPWFWIVISLVTAVCHCGGM